MFVFQMAKNLTVLGSNPLSFFSMTHYYLPLDLLSLEVDDHKFRLSFLIAIAMVYFLGRIEISYNALTSS